MTRDSLSSVSKPPKSTFHDIAALGPDCRIEIIDGELIEKEGATVCHGAAQAALAASIVPEYGRGGGNRTGGWWIAAEAHVELAPHEVYIPDLVGWRRENMTVLPTEWPARIRPDWICEVLSKSNAANDLVKKFRGYHAARVPHYWILDPEEESLVVYRYTHEGYLAVLTAITGETVRAEPFNASELRIAELFGHD